MQEGLHALVDVLAEPADLALRDAGAAHGLDEVVDGAGRDAVDVGLLDDRGERLLGGAARLQEARKVRALPQLRDRQIDLAGPGLPRPLAIAVAVVGALGAARPGRRAGELLDLGRHEALGAVGQQLADEIGVVGLM